MRENNIDAAHRVRSPVAVVALGLVALLLTSCQFAPQFPQNLEFSSPLFKANDVTRRAGKVGFGRLQFITAQHGQHRAAIVFVNADDFSVISDHYHQSRIFLRTWKELSEANLKFGDEGFVETSIGKISYEHFSYATNQCFQFYSVFDRSLSDDLSRERSIIAGYYCDDSGVHANTGQISDFLHGIRLSTSDSWNFVPRQDTSDLFAPKRRLFELRINPTGGPYVWTRY